MTRPGTASEPTMDEILASIRKIIAEEPSAKTMAEPAFAALTPTPFPAGGQRQGAATASRTGDVADRPAPLMERIASAGRAGEANVAADAAGGGDSDISSMIYNDFGDMLADATPAAEAPAATALGGAPRGAGDTTFPGFGAASAPVAGGVRTEPSFAAPAKPAMSAPGAAQMRGPAPSHPAEVESPAARNDAAAVGPDVLGAHVPLRHPAPSSGSVASRLPPLGGSGPNGDLGPFAAVRPGLVERAEAAPGEPRAPLSSQPAAAGWPDALRRAAEATPAAQPKAIPPEASRGADQSPQGPVVLAAMPAAGLSSMKPVVARPTAPNEATNLPGPGSLMARKPNAATEAGEVPAPPTAASEPVVLAAMVPRPRGTPAEGLSQMAGAPLRAPVKPTEAILTAEPAAQATAAKAPAGYATSDEIREAKSPPPASADAAANFVEPQMTPADIVMSEGSAVTAGVATTDPVTSAAAASALGALAAGLAASVNKSPAAGAAPVEAGHHPMPAAGTPRAQPDIVAGLAAAAPRPATETAPQTNGAAAEVPLVQMLSGAAAPASPGAADLAEGMRPAADSSLQQPSEAFLALANGPAPSNQLPSLMRVGAVEEPETGLDDTVAELLRPMLRQWLADNMPRIVEKALRIELAHSLKHDRRTGGLDRH